VFYRIHTKHANALLRQEFRTSERGTHSNG